MERPINLHLDEFAEEGLYLFFPDGDTIKITPSEIDKYFKEVAKKRGSSPRSAEQSELGLCVHCPKDRSGDAFCSALKPILPFLAQVDKYVSHKEVLAVFKNNVTGFITAKKTSLQNALKFVSLISLTRYCGMNVKYWNYFFGLRALSNPDQVAAQVYLNIYWIHRGDPEKTREAVDLFVSEIEQSAKSVINRLRQICDNDAFVNALVNAQIVTEFLTIDVEKTLKKAYDAHSRRFSFDGVM